MAGPEGMEEGMECGICCDKEDKGGVWIHAGQRKSMYCKAVEGSPGRGAMPGKTPACVMHGGGERSNCRL